MQPKAHSLATFPRQMLTQAFLTMILVAATFTVGAQTAGQSHSITIASFPFPPLLHESSSGEFSGTMGETVKALCKAAKLNCKFVIIPLNRAYVELRKGRVDALITINTNQLNDCCIPSEWSSPWTAGFFAQSDYKDVPDSEEQLRGKALILVESMRSPYVFAPRLKELAERGEVKTYKANSILSSVKMFLKKRAPLLWGGEDFKWYMGKIDPKATFSFSPKLSVPVVVWVNKRSGEILKPLNSAFQQLQSDQTLDGKNLLKPDLMKHHYLDTDMATE